MVPKNQKKQTGSEDLGQDEKVVLEFFEEMSRNMSAMNYTLNQIRQKVDSFNDTTSKMVSIGHESILNLFNRLEDLERKLNSFMMTVDALFTFMRDKGILDEKELQEYSEKIARQAGQR